MNYRFTNEYTTFQYGRLSRIRLLVFAQASSVECADDNGAASTPMQQQQPCALRLVAVLGMTSALQLTGEGAADVGHLALVPPASSSVYAAASASASARSGSQTPRERIGIGIEQSDEEPSSSGRREHLQPARSISSPDFQARLEPQAQTLAADERSGAAVPHSPTADEAGVEAKESVQRQVVDRLLICDTSNLCIKLVEVVRVRFSRSDSQEEKRRKRSSCSESPVFESGTIGGLLDNYHLHVQLASESTGWPCGSVMVGAGRLAVLETIRDPLHNVVKLIVNVYRSERLMRVSVLAASTNQYSPEQSFSSEELDCALCRGVSTTREAAGPSSAANGYTPRSSISSMGGCGESFEYLMHLSSLNESAEVLLCDGDGAFIGGLQVQYSSLAATAGQNNVVPSRVLVNALGFEYVFDLVPESQFRPGGRARSSREIANGMLRVPDSTGSQNVVGPRPKRISLGNSPLKSSVSISKRPFFRVAESHPLHDALFDLASNDHFNVVLYNNNKVKVSFVDVKLV